MDNSTLNLINIELSILREKQSKYELSLIDLKKLESLVNMRKTLVSTPETKEVSKVEEHLFTNDEIFDFLEARIAKSNEAKESQKAKEAKIRKVYQKKSKAQIPP